MFEIKHILTKNKAVALFSIGIYSSLFANEHRVVLHGHASHFVKEDRLGTEFNEKNYGMGYEYNSYDGIDNEYYVEPVLTFSANVIQDSYKKAFPFIGAGFELRSKGYVGISINISGFVGYKNLINTNKTVTYVNREFVTTYTKTSEGYSIMGGVTPGVKLYIGDFSFNYNYSPEFDAFGFYAEGFHYFSLSYKFN